LWVVRGATFGWVGMADGPGVLGGVD
jgi:hypothetical protein